MPRTPPPPALPVCWVEAPRPDDDRPAVRDWMAHVAAGRIGTPPVADPALAAVHAANAALIAGHRAARA